MWREDEVRNLNARPHMLSTFRAPSFTQLILKAAHFTRILPLGRQISYSLQHLQGEVAANPAAVVATSLIMIIYSCLPH